MAGDDEHNNPTPVQRRPPFQCGRRRIVTKALITTTDGIWAEELYTSPEITYQHTVLCQASLPYANPGELWEWERSQGAVSLGNRKAGDGSGSVYHSARSRG